jgi:predicted membrane channel-forming protein YqfA (hemolysin III family)
MASIFTIGVLLWILFPNEPEWLSGVFYILLNPISAIATIGAIAAIIIILVRNKQRSKIPD